MGNYSLANGGNASAFGNTAHATGDYATAVGTGSTANGAQASAFGTSANATGANTTATGAGAIANGDYASAFGSEANATGDAATAIGAGAIANGTQASAFGLGANATGDAATATGNHAIANGDYASAFGFNTKATGDAATATGAGAIANGVQASAFGFEANATGATATAVGEGTQASAAGAVALGQGAVANRAGLNGGAEFFSGTAVASTNGAVSVGTAGGERQITNVAGGTQATDAVNVRQLQAVGGNLAAALGGGSAFSTTDGTFTAPNYTVQGNNYNTVGGAVTALDSEFAGSSTNVDKLGTTTAAALGGGATYAANTGITGLSYGLNGSGTTYTDVVSGIQALAAGAAGPLQYGTPGTPSNTLTLVGTGGAVTLANVAAGQVSATSTQAVNGSQLYDLEQQVATLEGDGTGAFATNNSNNRPLPSATGTDSAAGGAGASASGAQSTAVGNASRASGANASAFGFGAAADGTNSTAIGYNNVATGANSTAVGTNNVAAGTNSTAVGTNNTVSGANSGAFGTGNRVTGNSSYAIGDPNTVNGNNSFVGGNNNTVNGAGVAGNGDNVNVIGSGNTVASTGSANGAAMVGNGSTVNSVDAVAVGNGVTVTGANGVAIGQGSSATLGNSVAVGAGSTTVGASSVSGNVAAGVRYNAGAVAAGSGNVFSVGTAGAERQIQNVAAGAVTRTSTDAVNGSQLYSVASETKALATGAAGLIQYSTPGTASNSVNLVGAGGPVTLGNLGPGAVNATSSQAINGSQLYGNAQSVARALGGGATVNADGTLGAPSYQIGSNTYNDVGSALTALQSDMQNGLANLQSRVDQNYHRANGGIAAAMASAGLRYDDRPGKISTGAALANWGGEFGIAGGVGATSNDGRWRLNAGFVLSPSAGGHTDVGGMGGLSYTWN